MSEAPPKRPLLLVIYPYKFHDFVYDLLELDCFKRYCDVLVWDVSPITTSTFANAISAGRSRKEGVIAITTLRDFARKAFELRKRSSEARFCIVNEVISHSFPTFICNLIISFVFLRTRNVAVLDLYNGGLPLRHLDGAGDVGVADHELGFIAKVLRFAKEASTLTEIKKRATAMLFTRLARLMPTATTDRLVAGEDWVALAKSKGFARSQIRLVCGHSHDYSNSLRHRQNPEVRTLPRFAVFLDGAAPMFGSDAALHGRKVYFSAEVWYPALCKFFDRLEAETGVRVQIAGHYKTTYPAISPIFGNRRVHYGKTAELVRDSEFVITRASTATCFAVAFRKPIIFIYSNQLSNDRIAMTWGRGMAKMLGKELVNIDESDVDILGLLTVDEERYSRYERACLTSDTSERPNVQIILNDIMNIDTNGDFRTKVNTG